MTGTRDRDDYLDRVLVGGREPVSTVTLLDYDTTWVDRFAALQHDIMDTLGAAALSVQHIGSSSGLHVYEPTNRAVAAHLDLRDWLRVDSTSRRRYATTKRRLAARQWSDMNHYADAKSEVIQELLAQAREWRLAT